MKLNLSAMLVAGAAGTAALQADEGMWTLDNPPLKQLQSIYGFTPTPEWLEHVRLASLRFNDGGSGSFVSPEGLVLTNHHVALGQLQKMSTPQNDFVKKGFYARKRSEEIPCPDLEINQLVSMENVTERVLSAIKPGASDKDANEQRKGAMAVIEKESTDKTGLRSDVVELYQGGEYWLYRYKKYKDVRLVMAPEISAAFYGGDYDNFTYPRFCLDFAFFRVYENGQPAKVERYFAWSENGAGEGELTFVTGHPGSTDRLLTVAQLHTELDYEIPTKLKMYRGRRERMRAYAESGPEAARRAQDYIFSLENGIKAISGEYKGLQDKEVFAQKENAEKEMRQKIAADKDLAKAYAGSWARIEELQKDLRSRYKEWTFRGVRGRKLANIANTIVRYVVETQKPNEKRYEEYRDSALDSLRFQLFSPAPIFPDMEEALLAYGLQESLTELGAEDPYVKAVLAGKTPEQVAKEAVAGTKLMDVDFRKKLIEGGPAAVEASTDPLIQLARRADPHYREMRKWYEDNIQSVERLEGNKIAKARFAVYGKNVYPDATFTLRMSYGKPAGYEWGETLVPYKTTFGGLYDRSDSFDNKAPFNLSESAVAARKTVSLSTPLNFVTTHDIIGGNSGSPVVNKQAELVGLIFDGNIQSLVGRYLYSPETNRAVSVHSSAIREALRSIYGMKNLLKEIEAGRKKA